MNDLILETVRAAVLACVCAYLWSVGQRRSELQCLGWRLILGGFSLLLFGSLLDITDNFDSLNRFVVVGETPMQAVLEKMVGFLGGFVLLGIGLARWIPSVTSRKKLFDSEARLRQIVDLLPSMIFAKNRQGRLLLVNRAMADGLDTTVEQLTGKFQADVHPDPDEVARMLAEDREVIDTGTLKQIPEQPYLDARGNEHWVQTVKIPYTTADTDEPAVLGVSVDITDRKRIERDLQYRIEFDQILNTISSDFVQLTAGEMDRGIQRAIETIGRFFGVDRSYVFLVREDGRTIDNTHEWCAADIEPQIDALKGVLLDEELPWFSGKIRNLEEVHIPSVEALPDEAIIEKGHFQEQKIQSLVVAPMVSGGELRGFLGFDSVREEKQWPDDIIRSLRIVGEIFINSIERNRAETELRESESRYRLLAEQTNDVIWTSDMEFNWGYISPSVERMLGFTAKEMMARSLEEMLTPRSVELVTKTLAEKIEAAVQRPESLHEPIIIEVEFHHKNGSTVWVESSVNFARRQDGQSLRMVGVNRDITERKRIENDLQYRIDFGQILNTISTSFVQLASSEIDHGIQRALEMIGQFFRVDRSYLFLAREDGLTFDNMLEWCAAGIEPQIDALQGILLDEEVPWFARKLRNLEEVHVPSVEALSDEAAAEKGLFQQQDIRSLIVTPMLSGGKLRGFLGFDSVRKEKQWPDDIIRLLRIVGEIFINSIERKRAETELREGESRYRLLAEQTSDVIWTSDMEFNWGYLSPSFERLSGFTAEEAMGMSLQEMLTPDSVQQARNVLTAKLVAAAERPESLEEPITTELEMYRADGSTIWVEINVKIYTGPDGQPNRMVGTTREVTERRQAQAQLAQAKEAAEAASRAKSEFLANMSHEIRTPMTAILGFADVLLDAPEEDEVRKAAQTITHNGEHLLEIINDILDLSRIEAGKMQLEQRPCSPGRLIAEVATLMEVRARAKGIRLATEFEGPLPESIQSDPTRLRQVLINLVGNAIKFTEVGSVRVITKMVDRQGDQPRLEIRVVDTGIGMSSQQMENVFEPFAQADSSTTRQFGGSGLGLAISRRVARRLGGDVQVTSSSGEGSTFVVTIACGPLEDVPWIEDPRIETFRADSPQQVSTPKERLVDCRVLLVEDGPDNQRLISLLLKRAGAQVTLAENGRIGLSRVREARDADRPFDVILMDMQMPVLDGYEATKVLRRDNYTRPIIALTAHAMASDRQKCLDAGCNDYLSKPIKKDLFIELVASHFQRTASSQLK